jgi:hypothetical protein
MTTNKNKKRPIGVDVRGRIRFRKSKKHKVITNGTVSITRAR